jgi:hypothetical protein
MSGPFLVVRDGGRIVASVTLRNAKEVRQFIVSDLRYLHFDRERIRTAEAPFGPLLIRLSEQATVGQWQCVKLGRGKAEPGQAILKLKRQGGITERWTTTFLPFGDVRTLKEKFYAILGRALLTGTLTRLKLCRQCGRYLVAVKDLKREFCEGTTCKDYFHSGQKKKVGYYTDRRKTQRKDAIKKARQLLAAGRAQKIPRRALFEQIEAATKLPYRVVEKVFEDEWPA